MKELLAFLVVRSLLPLKYLGLPIGARFETTAIWDGILETMEKRIATTTTSLNPKFLGSTMNPQQIK